jgi:hypothetical protein
MLPNIVLFEGVDATDTTSLWETNGTASGTFELLSNPPAVHGQAPITGEAIDGFEPNTRVSIDLTVFNNQVLFAGRMGPAEMGPYTLWTTDGTVAGTVPLPLISVHGASSNGLFSPTVTPGFTVFGDEVLFRGIDTGGAFGLWMTNGTAAGTKEITGIDGTASTGVNPSDMTVFNGAVLFNGTDTGGHFGLWTTNGTGGGTKELIPPVGAGASPTGLDPTDLTVFNNEVLFNGADADGLSGLWATNGTAGGTHELIAEAPGASSGLDPTDMTVIGNEVLFSGVDASGLSGLWVTNGTAGGTRELLAEAPGAGAKDPLGLNPTDLTVFNGDVFFNGLDQFGRGQLWELNGATLEPQMLTVAGAAGGIDPSNFEVYNDQLLFGGFDHAGLLGLWTTNGTATGTKEIIPNAKTFETGLQPVDLTALEATTTPPNFFNNVEEAGILWQNANGDTVLWNPNGSGGFTPEDLGVVPTSWQIAGTGDFNGAGEAGLLWRNADGDTALWNPNGSGGFVNQDLGVVGNSWQIAGTGAFTGTGEESILWRNANGDTALWNPNGSGGFVNQDLGIIGSSWQIAGTGAFTGTGEDSILWRNANGDTELWNPNGSGGFAGEDLGVIGTSWQIAGTGDFSGKGESSILWRNANGDTELWNPNGSGGFAGEDLGVIGTSWQIAGTGDFSGTGQSGILWRNTDGDTALWNPNGSGGFTSQDLGVVGTSWSVHKISA